MERIPFHSRTKAPIRMSSTAGTNKPNRPTWLEIDADALTNNVQQIRKRIPPLCLLMGVVKANAYGHGALATAQVLWSAGCDRFAVAALAEGIELRAGGLTAPILVLGYTPTWLVSDALEHHIALTVYDLSTAEALNQAAAQVNQQAVVHVKVNTGMNRLGLLPEAVPSFLLELQRLPYLHVEGIFTHFATSDLGDKTFALEQFTRFQTLLNQLTQMGLRPSIAHAANSAATLTLPETHLDMVRCGITLYGLHPDADDTPLPDGFRPALQWKAQVAQVMQLRAGDSVSYGQEFVATQPMTVAVIPVGYADGFPRRPYHWGSVLIHGRPAPILGRVCMDQTIVDVTATVQAGSAVQQGDEVVLIGRQGSVEVTAEEVGRRLHTINYDVVSRILARVPRILQNG
jgi:alanine racemase